MEVEFPGKTSAHTAGSPPPVGPLVRSRAPKRPKLSEMEVSTSQFQCPTGFWPTTRGSAEDVRVSHDDSIGGQHHTRLAHIERAVAPCPRKESKSASLAEMQQAYRTATTCDAALLTQGQASENLLIDWPTRKVVVARSS